MENNKYDNDVVEIDLGEIIALMIHRLWVIILCAVMAGAAGFAVSRFLITDMYESSTKVYILNKSGGSEIVYSDVQLSSQLTKDYAQLIKSRTVLEQVIEDYKSDMSYAAFADRVDVEAITDTRIISITVEDENPAMAQLLADEIRKEASICIKDVMDIQAVNVVDEANLPEKPASPSVPKWTLMGAVLGAVMAMAIILARYMLDDTIRTADDVEKYLGLSTLGQIPVREDADKLKNQHRRGRYVHRTEPADSGDEEEEPDSEEADDTLTMVDVEEAEDNHSNQNDSNHSKTKKKGGR